MTFSEAEIAIIKLLKKINHNIGILFLTLIVVLYFVITIDKTELIKARYNAVKTPGLIKCYSAGQIIYDGKSVGKVNQIGNVFEFKEDGTGMLIMISGDCVVIN